MKFTLGEWNMIKHCVEVAQREFAKLKKENECEGCWEQEHSKFNIFRRQENECFNILEKFKNEEI